MPIHGVPKGVLLDYGLDPVLCILMVLLYVQIYVGVYNPLDMNGC